jgi:hypothetical protein
MCDSIKEGHEHPMIICEVGFAGDTRRQPLRDRFGNLVSRAPRWYLEAVGLIPGWTPVDWEQNAF